MTYYEGEELACTVLGADYDAIVNADAEDEIEEKLMEKFGIDLGQFMEIAGALLKLTPKVSSPLTGKAYHAFVRDEGNTMVAIVKE